VTGVGAASGGTVEYPIGGTGTLLPTGSNITIVRSVPILQPESILNQGAVVPSRWMAMADRLTLVSQDLQEQLGRALLSPVTAPGSETALTETAGDLRYMKLAGDTFTGAPSYASDPASANVLCRRSYITNNYVPLAGGVTLTGDLSRTVDPSSSNHLVRKSYVDDLVDMHKVWYGDIDTHSTKGGSAHQSQFCQILFDGAGGSFAGEMMKTSIWVPGVSVTSSYADVMGIGIYPPLSTTGILITFTCHAVTDALGDVGLDVEFHSLANGAGTHIDECLKAWYPPGGHVSTGAVIVSSYQSPGSTDYYTVYVRVKKAEVPGITISRCVLTLSSILA
jgi:hypothetical protein